MGLFTTRQLLGYTEQKVKFRALFLELFFRRTVNFHTEEVMLDKITGKTPVAAYVSPIVEGKVLRHRGGETRVLRPGYVKPKHEFNYQQAVERLPGEDPSQLNDPAYRRLRIITDNLKQEEHAIVQVEEMQAVNAVLYGKYTMEGDQFEKIEVDFGRSTKNNITQGSGKEWSKQDRDTFDPTHDIDLYPNTAIVGLQVDAEQFGGQQMTVNYHIRGRIIQVPSNYDPEKRTYSGIWDGSLKPAYSNNPAWCLWDMLTHPRYGMGKRLGAADVDKWALYAIGQYCDQMVPDGFGGTEPRMTFNAYLAQQRKAWDVLSDFCSAMRCMPVWNGQMLTFVQDRLSDVVWPYTNSDVVVDDNGVGFRYSFSALKDRHTAVEVNYTDPQNGWQTSTELVEDPEAILRYGRNLLKMDAFGCTSRGQAHRAGLWVIKTELLETQTVDFTLGSQGLRHTPGDIIEICDNDYAGTLTGGRVLSIDAATRTLTLDREVTLPETGTSAVNLINGSGKPVSVDITAHPAPDRIQVSNGGPASCGV